MTKFEEFAVGYTTRAVVDVREEVNVNVWWTLVMDAWRIEKLRAFPDPDLKRALLDAALDGLDGFGSELRLPAEMRLAFREEVFNKAGAPLCNWRARRAATRIYRYLLSKLCIFVDSFQYVRLGWGVKRIPAHLSASCRSCWTSAGIRWPFPPSSVRRRSGLAPNACGAQTG